MNRKRRVDENILDGIFLNEQILTSVEKIFDRRIKISSFDKGEVALYSILRAWAHDDPSMAEPMLIEQTISTGKRDLLDNVDMDRIKQLIAGGEKELADVTELFKNSKDDHRLQDHIKSFKKIRNRNKLLFAARYCRSKVRLADSNIPRLAALDNILEECQMLSHTSIR